MRKILHLGRPVGRRVVWTCVILLVCGLVVVEAATDPPTFAPTVGDEDVATTDPPTVTVTKKTPAPTVDDEVDDTDPPTVKEDESGSPTVEEDESGSPTVEEDESGSPTVEEVTGAPTVAKAAAESSPTETSVPSASPTVLDVEETSPPTVKEEDEDEIISESPTLSLAPTIDEDKNQKETPTDSPTVDSDAEITSDPSTSSPTDSPTMEPATDGDDYYDDDPYDQNDDPFERDPDSTYIPPDDDPVDKDPEDDAKWIDDGSNAQHNETPEEMMHDKNIQILVGVLVALGFAGMLYSAYQVMQNPDGLCASICRLSIRCISCLFSVLCLPCRFMFGGDRQDSNYSASPLGRDDHSFANDLELT